MASDRPQQNRLLGIGLRFGAITCFAFMAAAIKLGYQAGVSTVELGFYRFAFGLPPLLLWIGASGNWGAWRTQRPAAHLWRAVVGLGTMLLAFSALAYLPLAESTTIGFAAPLFAVMRPGGTDLPPIGLALAVAAAFGVGVVTITIRQIGKTEHPQTTVLWFTLLSMLTLATLMPFHAGLHEPWTWAVLAALGLFGGFGQLFLTASLRYAPVSVVVPFDYTQLLWAVLLGWLIFGDHPPATTWGGAAVIILSGLYTLYREHKLGRERARAAPPL